jgi:hypothetical protein
MAMDPHVLTLHYFFNVYIFFHILYYYIACLVEGGTLTLTTRTQFVTCLPAVQVAWVQFLVKYFNHHIYNAFRGQKVN